MAAPFSHTAPSESEAKPKPKPTLNAILREMRPQLDDVPWLDSHKRAVLRQLSTCGTKDAGEYLVECLDCGDRRWMPASCQSRYCPSCGAARAEEWVQARLRDCLDVPCFHATFGIPQPLHVLCREDPEVLYTLLFAAVQQTLKAFVAKLDQLSGTPAFFCVLHTADRRMDFYPHIHVFIAGAAFDEASGRLTVADPDKPLFPVAALADAFRDRFLEGLRDRHKVGALQLSWDKTRPLAEQQAFDSLLESLESQRWSVWLQPSAGPAETTIRYLATYIQRTAITNTRIVRADDKHVTYQYKKVGTGDWYRRTLPTLEFLKLFAQHILPNQFQRVRYYGLFCPIKRAKALPKALRAASDWAKQASYAHALTTTPPKPPPFPPQCCEACGSTRLRVIALRWGHTLTIIHPPTLCRPPPEPDASARREAV